MGTEKCSIICMSTPELVKHDLENRTLDEDEAILITLSNISTLCLTNAQTNIQSVSTTAFLTGHSVARYIHLLALLNSLTRFAALRLLAVFTGSLTRFAHSLMGQ